MSIQKYSRAQVKWPVVIQAGERTMDGVTWKVSPNGVFIKCAKPLRLHEVCDLAIRVPGAERPLEVSVEVVWSNIHGQDDEVTPRGMGARFIKISSEDRQAIAKQVLRLLNPEEVDQSELRALETILEVEEEADIKAA